MNLFAVKRLCRVAETKCWKCISGGLVYDYWMSIAGRTTYSLSCSKKFTVLGPLVIQGGESGDRLYVFHQKRHTHLFQLFSKLSVFIPFPFLRLQISLNITGNTGILQWTEMECHLGRLTQLPLTGECSANIIYSSGGVQCAVTRRTCYIYF
jgi:hypothetical protein